MIDQLWQEEMRARRLVDEEIAPFLAEHGDLAATFRISDGFTSAVGATVSCRFVPPRTQRITMRRSPGDRRFLYLVAWKIRAEREALYKHEQVVNAAQDTLPSLLQAEIERRR